MTSFFLIDVPCGAWPSKRLVNHWHYGTRRPLTLCSNRPFPRNGEDRSDVLLHQSFIGKQCRFSNESRTRQTSVDDEYKNASALPEPRERHIELPTIADSKDPIRRSGIFVIGDVHGCYDEMIALYEKAIAENDNQLFDYVILVGDVCNKGPKSMAVIRHLRKNFPRWLSVRGNHEHSILKAALGMADSSLKQSKYNWLVAGDEYSNSDAVTTLSDEDVVWMANLPYTIRIPCHITGDEYDTIIVHAGLIPGVRLEDMDAHAMVVMRELECPITARSNLPNEDYENSARTAPWASLWNGPEHVIFGHDAKRGLQQYEYASGLDTGCVYGKKLTGIILPQRKVVQVDARKPYVSIIEKC